MTLRTARPANRLAAIALALAATAAFAQGPVPEAVTPAPAPAANEAPPPEPAPPPAAAAPLPTVPPPPPTAVREVRETLHDTEVADPYRWLEDVAAPETQAWFRAQSERTKAVLARLPGRDALLARIRELNGAEVTITRLAMAGSRVFYLRQSAGNPTPVLCVRDGFAGKERVLVDPAKAAKDGASAAIAWHHPSPDGRLVAYGLAADGTEDATLRVVDAGTGRDAGIALGRARFNDALAWHHDGTAFYYARIPEGGRPDPAHRNAGIRVYRHVVGRPAKDDEVIFASGVGGALDVPEIVYPSLLVPEDSVHAYAVARHGVRRELAVYVTSSKDLARGLPRWTKIVDPADGVVALQAWKDDLYLLTHKDAPRFRVLVGKVGAKGMARPRVAVPEGDTVILGMALAADALYLRTTVGGLERLERLNLGLLASRTPEFIKTAFDVAIAQMVTHPRRPGAVLRMQGFLEAPSVVTVEAKTGNLRNTGLQPPSPANFAEMDEVRLYAPGHDGTKVPVTLLYRKSTMLSGDRPTLLVGYGAYGLSLTPAFDASRLAWLERGGIIAFAHVRGGGEYGEAWHRAGYKATKENTIRDFIACAEFLVKYGFTSPKHLAAQGTSAGGIPAGGALVRRPDLFAAVVPRVAVLDMLRFEYSANGPANIPEFGSVATREGFEALYRMSAYHQVKPGMAYPAVLLTAGMNDPRVDPWHAGKMAARLQAASPDGNPVLLRVDWQGGHGPGATRAQREEELADIYAFLLWRMGEEDFALR